MVRGRPPVREKGLTIKESKLLRYALVRSSEGSFGSRLQNLEICGRAFQYEELFLGALSWITLKFCQQQI